MASKKPTTKQIQAEIKRLKDMKPTVRRRTFFGDDNHAALDAQVRVLDEQIDEARMYDIWEDNDHVLSSAREALEWMNDSGEESPSQGWKSLVVQS